MVYLFGQVLRDNRNTILSCSRKRRDWIVTRLRDALQTMVKLVSEQNAGAMPRWNGLLKEKNWKGVIACFYLLLVVLSRSVHAEDRPNILFIFSDDHAYQAISAYDSKLTETPHIDRIANEGMRFDRCYVTNSICGPSRACVLTGQYSHKNGYYKNDEEFDSSLVTFPPLLQDAGYQTAVIGKWHLGTTLPQGFDYWKIMHHQGFYYQPKFIDPTGRSQHVGYVTDLVTDYSLQWLKEKRDPDRPFMLMMQHKAPHRPWDPAPEYLNKFADREFPEPTTLFDDYSTRTSAARRATMQIGKHMNTEGADLKAWDNERKNGDRDWFYGKLTTSQHDQWLKRFSPKNAKYYAGSLEGDALVRWKYQRYLQDYLACVASVDDSVGKVLDYLDESQLAENTIVIYCSDQGFYLGEHGWFDKRFMYEQSLRTPLVMRWPKRIKSGQVNEQIVSNLDFAETFLDLAGVQVPEPMQGRSLVPLMDGAAPADWRKSFYYHYYEGLEGGHNVCAHEGVTTGTHKLIHFYPLGEWELFDLSKDRHELNNVADNDAYREVRQRLENELRRLREELGVPKE